MKDLVRAARHAKREAEVMAEIKRCRVISVFWLQSPLTRWAALQRLENSGVIRVKVLGYPNYRVTIRRPNRALSCPGTSAGPGKDQGVVGTPNR